MKHYLILSLMLGLLLAGCSGNAPKTESYRGAPLLEGMSDYNMTVSTDNPLAQRYFNQGMILGYGFNHAEAARSFREAGRLDPDFAMAHWGLALVLGPNINAGMDDKDVPEAFAASQKAFALSGNATQKEKALINALMHRYAEAPVADRSPLDQAYADAMVKVAEKYPGDANIVALAGEALMDLHPWDFWEIDGRQKPWTAQILSTLEASIALDENHPLANHLYIHAVEASKNPARGLPSADRLRFLVPGAGHLVHMPAHIYIRTGKYHEARLANERAVAADNNYVTQCHAQGLYPLAYHPHNYHFLWMAATMEGNAASAINAARKVAEHADQKVMREPGYGTLQHFYSMPYYALIKFGKWDELLKMPAPEADLVYPTGVYHFARGMAFKGIGEIDKAREELAKLRVIAADTVLNSVTIWDINTTAVLMKIAVEQLNGEIYAVEKRFDKALDCLQKAKEIEDQLNYDEPPPWYSPVRHSLGAVLLDAGQHVAAEQAYREDLANHPENGWALYGLYRSLSLQGKTQQADAVKQRFQKAWAYADVELTSSKI